MRAYVASKGAATKKIYFACSRARVHRMLPTNVADPPPPYSMSV